MMSSLLFLPLTLLALALSQSNAAAASSAVETSAGATVAPPLHVMIDPGHGGVDTGAVKGPLKESEIALKVSLQLAKRLKADSRFKVSMTRDHDKTLSLEERAERAQDAKVDLYLSVHLNSSTDPRAQGKEFYFQNQLPVDEESMFLASRENSETGALNSASSIALQGKSGQTEQISAKADVRKILEDLNRNERIHASGEFSQILFETWMGSGKSRKSGSRAIRQAPFYVVSNVPAPSVLVELGFITHQQEGPRLGTAAYQNELADSLYAGIVKFKETVDKDAQPTLKSADAL